MPLKRMLVVSLVIAAVCGCGGGGGGGAGGAAPSALATSTSTSTNNGATGSGVNLTRSQPLRAGVATVDMTPGGGVPLGGFGDGARRLTFPDVNPFNLNTLFAAPRG